jgi:uncharacterized protein YgiM (DUF1202 family)
MRFFSLCFVFFWACPAWADSASVVSETRVNLRSGRTEASRVVKALEPGAELIVLREERAYAQVKTAEGDVGWLPLRMLKIIPTPAVKAPPSREDPTIQALRAQVAAAQAELKQAQVAQRGLPLWIAVSAGLGGLVLGLVLGMAGLQAYYRKRLHGLRI